MTTTQPTDDTALLPAIHRLILLGRAQTCLPCDGTGRAPREARP